MAKFDSAACAALLEAMTAISIAAAQAIRGSLADSGVRLKADGSPVTAADEAAEAVIRDGLARLGASASGRLRGKRSTWPGSIAAPSFILVDPLDGTREFIAGRDEYAINMASSPTAPPPPASSRRRRSGASGAASSAAAPSGCNFPPDELPRRRGSERGPAPAPTCWSWSSRSHLDARTEAYLQRWPAARPMASGSAIKFCRVAEGSADFYPRLGPTHDWDVAAGHAIVAAAGGCSSGRPAGPSLTAVRG